MTVYADLERRFRRIALIGDSIGMLHWDMSVMMPPGGAEARGEQMAVLKTLAHELLTAPETGDLLEAAEAGSAGLDVWRRANLREMRRLWRHATAVPGDLVEALSRSCSACETVWRTARAEADFGMVLPTLKEVLALIRETARAKAESLGVSPYDALLDEYEPGGRAARIDSIFADLEAFLPGFLQEVLEAQGRGPRPVAPPGPFPVEAQRALGTRLMGILGFDFAHGRLDVSTHPFCGGATGDIRITTRYDEADFATALMGVLHETGHALYEAGLPEAWRHQPVGAARGMSLHESQSLLIEMQVCRSRAFLDFAAPLMREAFGGSGPAWEADNLHRLSTRVEPGFIRVDADEVTYPAHVILRYRLEKALIEGRMEPPDLPAAWNEGMERLLGLTPPSDREGCLQDIHWYDGAWGYFPTYTLGAMTAAQLFDAARRAAPGIVPAIAGGDFAPLLGWLRANVHSQGSRLPAEDLMAEATGRPLDAEVYKRHLRTRYLEVA